MTHEWKWGRLLRRNREGDLRPSDAERWRRHRDECRQCRSDEAAFDELETALRSARPEPTTLEPEGARRILQAALVQSGALRRRSPWIFPMWGIATAVVCTVAALIAWHAGGGNPANPVVARGGPQIAPPINRSKPSLHDDVFPTPVAVPQVAAVPALHSGQTNRRASRQVRLARAEYGQRSTTQSGLRAPAVSASALNATVLLAGIRYQRTEVPASAVSPSADHATVLLAGIPFRPASQQPSGSEELPTSEPLTSPAERTARFDEVAPAVAAEPAVLFVAVTDVPHSPVALTVREARAEQPGMARACTASGMADGRWLLTEVTVSSEQDSPTLVLRSISPPAVR